MKIFGYLVTPLATLFSLILGLAAWRFQLIEKRRYEIAEQALTAAEAAVDALKFARSRITFAGEGLTRKADPGESESETKAKNFCFVPVERLKNSNDTFKEVFRLQALCEFHFGPEAKGPFSEVISVHEEIRNLALTLMDMADDEHDGDLGRRDARRRIRAKLYGTASGEQPEDVIGERIEKVNRDVKRIFGPYLRPGWRELLFPYWR